MSRRRRRRARRSEARASPKEVNDGAPGSGRLGAGARRMLAATALRHGLCCPGAWPTPVAGLPALLPPDAGSLHSSCIRHVGPSRRRSPALANKLFVTRPCMMISEVWSNGRLKEDF
ncbi:hypothetical protein VPH35_056239 [Triticum aestivum]